MSFLHTNLKKKKRDFYLTTAITKIIFIISRTKKKTTLILGIETKKRIENLDYYTCCTLYVCTPTYSADKVPIQLILNQIFKNIFV